MGRGGEGGDDVVVEFGRELDLIASCGGVDADISEMGGWLDGAGDLDVDGL